MAGRISKIRYKEAVNIVALYKIQRREENIKNFKFEPVYKTSISSWHQLEKASTRLKNVLDWIQSAYGDWTNVQHIEDVTPEILSRYKGIGTKTVSEFVKLSYNKRVQKRTSEIWYLSINYIILDRHPEVWDQENWDYSWSEELLTKSQFEEKLVKCKLKKKPLQSDFMKKWINQR